jgi:hypothetical protein
MKTTFLKVAVLLCDRANNRDNKFQTFHDIPTRPYLDKQFYICKQENNRSSYLKNRENFDIYYMELHFP